MLIISRPSSVAQLERYHVQEFSNSRENHYTETATIPGLWHGRLAARWGLEGHVDEYQFRQLAEGRHPLTGAMLVRRQTAYDYTNQQGKRVRALEHRAAWEATFSAPKSISLAALVGNDARIAEAHRVSVTVALEALEPYVQTHLKGRPETTGQWVAARFEHDSARPVHGYAAPHLHTHVVIFNVTENSNGKTRALEPRQLFKSQQYATAVYRSELAWRLTSLGYDVERGPSDQPEIRGFTHEYLEASSPRRQQIKVHLETTAYHGLGAALIANYRTREAKIELSHDSMQRRHRELAAAFGDQPARIVAAARERESAPKLHQTTLTADAAVLYATTRNTERHAPIEERSVLRDALKRSMGELLVRDIRDALERSVRNGDLIAVDQTSERPGRTFTTPEMVALERDTIERMRLGQGTQHELAQNASTISSTCALAGLTEPLRVAVDDLLRSRNQILALDGAEGAGKTMALAAIRDVAERSGHRVVGLAPTSRAMQTFAEAGILATTLQRHLNEYDGVSDGSRRFYIIDDSRLAGVRQLNQLLRGLDPSHRVLLVGDRRQHQSIEAGSSYQLLQEAGLAVVRLDIIVRQRDDSLKQVFEQSARGRGQSALVRLEAQGRVHEIQGRNARLAAIADDFARRPNGTLVVSADNGSCCELNAIIHRQLQRTGQVGGRETHVQVLIPRNDVSGADRLWAGRYRSGNLVRYTRRSDVFGLKAGEYGHVSGIDIERNRIAVIRHDGTWVEYDPRRLVGVTLYSLADRSFSVGDRVQFTARDRSRRFANRELGTISSIALEGHMQIRLDSGRRVTLARHEHHHLEYGYAVTSHVRQGPAADRVLVHVETGQGEHLVNRRFACIAGSRARYDAQIYTDDKTQLFQRLSTELSNRTGIEADRAPVSIARSMDLSW